MIVSARKRGSHESLVKEAAYYNGTAELKLTVHVNAVLFRFIYIINIFLLVNFERFRGRKIKACC